MFQRTGCDIAATFSAQQGVALLLAREDRSQRADHPASRAVKLTFHLIPPPSPACSRRRRHAGQPVHPVCRPCLAVSLPALLAPSSMSLTCHRGIGRGFAAIPAQVRVCSAIRALSQEPVFRVSRSAVSARDWLAHLVLESIQIAYSSTTSCSGLNPDETACGPAAKTSASRSCSS